MTGVIMVANVFAGRVSARYGVRRAMMAGLSLAILGYVVTTTIEPTSSIVSLIPGFLIVGCGIGLTVPSLMAAALAGMVSERVGIGAGVHNAARQVGGALGVALFASFIASDRSHVVDAVWLSILVSVATLISALLATTFLMSNPNMKS
jgi:MFS transporter, DHA2 family, methylenomycin A resistance protein